MLAGFSVLASAAAQTESDPNEGTKLTRKGSGSWTFSWWGRAGRSYFIQQSHDLSLWEYKPIIKSGTGEIIEWAFTSSVDRTFLRIRHSDIPTSDPFLADFDGDAVNNYDELFAGTDPLHFNDQDGDGLSDATDPNPAIPNPAAPAAVHAVVPDVAAGLRDPDRTKVEIRWEADGAFVTEFVVERRADGTGWGELARVGPTVRSYLDQRLSASRNYEYRVLAVHDPAGESLPSTLTAGAAVSYEVPWLRKLSVQSNAVSGNKHSFFPAFVYPTRVVILDGMPFIVPVGPVPYYGVKTIHRTDDFAKWTFDYRATTSAMEQTTNAHYVLEDESPPGAEFPFHQTTEWSFSKVGQRHTNGSPSVVETSLYSTRFQMHMGNYTEVTTSSHDHSYTLTIGSIQPPETPDPPTTSYLHRHGTVQYREQQ